jgi:hypothetical protein
MNTYLNNKNLLGQKVFMLTPQERVTFSGDSAIYFKCLCDCGNTKVIRKNNIVAGITKACGCLSQNGVTYEENKPSQEYSFIHKKDLEHLLYIGKTVKSIAEHYNVPMKGVIRRVKLFNLTHLVFIG